MSVTTVTDEELALLDFSSWKADQWLEDAVELETRFGISPDAGSQGAAAEARPLLYRLMEWLLVCNLTLVVVMLLLYGKGATSEPTQPKTSPKQPWEQAFHAARQGSPRRAVEILEQYLRANPEMSEYERGLTYNLLAFFLVRDGRFEEAGDFERQSHAIVSRGAGDSEQWSSGAGHRDAAPAPR